MARGQFITLEGIDGCGKSTHLRMLADALTASGLTPIVTREPGGTVIGERVRRVVLTGEGGGLVPAAELLLYAADRAQHVVDVIRPALEAGRLVLCDRYVDSTVAFQGYGRGIDLTVIRDLNRIATGGLAPDLTILLDVAPSIARTRLDSRRTAAEAHCPDRFEDRFEEEASEFHARVREGYLQMAAADLTRFVVIDSSAPPDVTHKKILDMVMTRLKMQSC